MEKTMFNSNALRNYFNEEANPNQFNKYTLRCLLGVVAITLPFLEYFWITNKQITSISASFWWHDLVLARNIFVGFLFIVSSIALAYKGKRYETWLARIICISAILVAMIPCECTTEKNLYNCPTSRETYWGTIHLYAAGILFLCLTLFCRVFRKNTLKFRDRTNNKIHPHRRIFIFNLCSIGMATSICLFIYYLVYKKDDLVILDYHIPVILVGEFIGLVSFGLSWLIASRVLPWFSSNEEREKLVF
jgi:hypothetical protein